MYHSLSMYLPIEGPSWLFPIFGYYEKTAVINHMQILWEHKLPTQIGKNQSVVTGWYGKPWSTLVTVFQNGCSISHSHHQ
jgi:hypothetical protein